MAQTLAPDVELVTVTFLKAQAAISSLVGTRVYTVVPNSPTWPLLRVVRIGGGPLSSYPLHLDQALLQIDAYGGSKYEARTLVETVKAELAEIQLASHSGAVVTGANFGTTRYLPDSTFDPARPRYVADVEISIHGNV